MKKKNIILLSIIALILVFYCSFSITILWDSGHYMTYIDILEGNAAFNTWDIVRGPVFPLLITISRFLFGKTVMGLIIMTVIFYMLMLFFVKKILDRITVDILDNRKKCFLYIGAYGLLIINPIIFGYYHALLTEFVAMTFAVIMCYCAWRWININYAENKKLYIVYTIIFSTGIVLSWHLKQPYVSVTLFPVFIAALISVLQNKNWKNLLQRGIVLCICAVSLFSSIVVWNKILEIKNVPMNIDRNVTAVFGRTLLSGMNNFHIIQDTLIDVNYLKNNQYLENDEKEKLISRVEKGIKDFYIIEVYDLNSNVTTHQILDFEGSQVLPTSTAVMYLLKSAISHPLLVMDSYLSGYLAMANLYPKASNDGVEYRIVKDFTWNNIHENGSIANGIADVKSNIFNMPDESYERVREYEQINDAPYIFRGILKVAMPIWNTLYSVLLLALPFLCLVSIFIRIKFRIGKQYVIEKMNLCLILFGFSFLHIMAHVVTGACIDRYVSPALVPIILGIIVLIVCIYEVNITKNMETTTL